jgi:hypothetical protein
MTSGDNFKRFESGEKRVDFLGIMGTEKTHIPKATRHLQMFLFPSLLAYRVITFLSMLITPERHDNILAMSCIVNGESTSSLRFPLFLLFVKSWLSITKIFYGMEVWQNVVPT